jgi:hypothetical protein
VPVGARNAGVKRLMLTSSFGALGSARKQQRTGRNVMGKLSPLPEIENFGETPRLGFHRQRRGARTFRRQSGSCFRPAALSSIFGPVEVRNVADLHLRPRTHARAKGERFLAVAGDFMSMLDIAKVLKGCRGTLAKRVQSRELPPGGCDFPWGTRLLTVVFVIPFRNNKRPLPLF